MLFRYLLLVCLVIVSAMPVCVAENASDTTITSPTFDEAMSVPIETKEITMPTDTPAQPAQAMTMEDALKHVTVSTEDWLDGNTYYIRYTFTNPTSVAIDKKVDLTTVKYRRCAYNELFGFSQRGSTAIATLAIPPHGTYTTTLEFPLFIPVAQYYRLLSTALYFTDGSALYHGYCSTTPTLSQNESEPPLYLLSAFVSDKNDLCLAIRNRSRLTPITSISDLTVQLKTLNPSNGLIDLIAPDPLPINIPPRQTQIFKLFTLSPKLFLSNDDPIIAYLYTIANPTLEVDIKLNDTFYSYLVSLLPKPPYTTLDEIINTSPLTTLYRQPLSPINFAGNAYRIDGSDLSVYFQLTNTTNQTICAPSADYILPIDYFTTGTYYQSERIKIFLPADFTLAPQETKFFSCQIPLVTDFYRLDPNEPLKLHSFAEALPFDLHTITLVPLDNTELPHPSTDYQPLKVKTTSRFRH